MPYLTPNANVGRNNITAALMNIARPSPQTVMPQLQGGANPLMPPMAPGAPSPLGAPGLPGGVAPPMPGGIAPPMPSPGGALGAAAGGLPGGALGAAQPSAPGAAPVAPTPPQAPQGY